MSNLQLDYTITNIFTGETYRAKGWRAVSAITGASQSSIAGACKTGGISKKAWRISIDGRERASKAECSHKPKTKRSTTDMHAAPMPEDADNTQRFKPTSARCFADGIAYLHGRGFKTRLSAPQRDGKSNG